MRGGETWIGKGAIGFPSELESHSMHRLRVLRYEGAVYMRGAGAVIYPADEVWVL